MRKPTNAELRHAAKLTAIVAMGSAADLCAATATGCAIGAIALMHASKRLQVWSDKLNAATLSRMFSAEEC